MIWKKNKKTRRRIPHTKNREEKEQKQIFRERIITITIDCVFASLLVAAVRYHHPGNEINTCSYPLPFHFIHRTNERRRNARSAKCGIIAKNVADAHWEWLCWARIRILWVYDFCTDARSTQQPLQWRVIQNVNRAYYSLKSAATALE